MARSMIKQRMFKVYATPVLLSCWFNGINFLMALFFWVASPEVLRTLGPTRKFFCQEVTPPLFCQGVPPLSHPRLPLTSSPRLFLNKSVLTVLLKWMLTSYNGWGDLFLSTVNEAIFTIATKKMGGKVVCISWVSTLTIRKSAVSYNNLISPGPD